MGSQGHLSPFQLVLGKPRAQTQGQGLKNIGLNPKIRIFESCWNGVIWPVLCLSFCFTDSFEL